MARSLDIVQAIVSKNPKLRRLIREGYVKVTLIGGNASFEYVTGDSEYCCACYYEKRKAKRKTTSEPIVIRVGEMKRAQRCVCPFSSEGVVASYRYWWPNKITKHVLAQQVKDGASYIPVTDIVPMEFETIGYDVTDEYCGEEFMNTFNKPSLYSNTRHLKGVTKEEERVKRASELLKNIKF